MFLAACNKNQLPQDTGTIEQVISTKKYVFLAETANPLGSSVVRLTPGYDLIINENAIVATLPYFGRAYNAPIDRTGGGIRFNSTQFQYHTMQDDKGNWHVTIRPQDVADVQELTLHITTDGYATLYVTSNNRQAISYHGRVQRS